MQKLDLSANEYFSCSAPAPHNRGCRWYGMCTFPFKAQPGHAPENIGVYRQSGQSGRTKTMVMPCHRYYDKKREWEDSKDVIHIIAAAEGSGIKAPTKMPVQETYEEARELVTSTVSGRSMPVVKRRIVNREIPRFERPGEVDPERETAAHVRAMLQEYAADKAHRELMTGTKESEFASGLPLPGAEEPSAEKPPASRHPR